MLLCKLIESIELVPFCGQNHTFFSYKNCGIVGGYLCHEGEWPWQAFLNITINYGNIQVYFQCGASIINKDWILTAAHCVHEVKNPNSTQIDIEAVFGSVDLLANTKCKIKRKIIKIISYEKFDYNAMINDIALLKLNSSLNLDGKHLNAICLPKLSTEFYQYCYATGYGLQNLKSEINDYKLRKIPEIIYELEKCKKHFPDIDSRTNICIGGIGGHGTCRGDSGSPLQCYHSKEKRWYQMGLVSYGQPCALPNVPDVLTRVAYFYDWILQQ